MIVARDIAHSKLKKRLDKGQKLPKYFVNHPVYYAGPAKTPKGYNTDHLDQRLQEEWTSYCRKISSQ